MGGILPQVDGACILAGMSTPLDAVKIHNLTDIKFLAGESARFNGALQFLLIDPRQKAAIKDELQDKNIEELLLRMGWVVNAGITFGKAIKSPQLEVPRIELVLSDTRITSGSLRSLRIMSASADSDVILK